MHCPGRSQGGWDFTCRTVGRLLREEDIVDGSVQVANMPGGVGAVAFANVASGRASDEDLIVATSTVGITQIAQGKCPGEASVMRFVVMLGADVGIFAVAKDSPHKSLEDLFGALKEDPNAVVAAGSPSAGGWDHIRLLLPHRRHPARGAVDRLRRGCRGLRDGVRRPA